MNEAMPIEVIHVTSRASTDEAGRDDLPPVESPLFIKGTTVNQPTGVSRSLATVVLNDEPLRKTPGSDS
jgi:hypothetical protein